MNANKAALVGVCVRAYAGEPSSGATPVASTVTENNAILEEEGFYELTGLSTSTGYVIEYSGCGKVAVVTSYYKNEAPTYQTTNPKEATPVLGSELELPIVTLEAAVLPASTGAPAVSGSPTVGSTLTCSPGTWTGTPAPTYSYQWLRDGDSISGATSSTYVVQTADQGDGVACEVTASNDAGSASATSAAVQVPAPVSQPTTKKEEPKPGTAVANGTASVKAGKLQLSLTCTGQGACKGAFELTAMSVAKHHGKRKRTTVTIGKASFSITAEGHQTVSVHLTGTGKSLIAKAGKHGLKAQLSGSDIDSRTVLLKLLASKKGKG